MLHDYSKTFALYKSCSYLLTYLLYVVVCLQDLSSGVVLAVQLLLMINLTRWQRSGFRAVTVLMGVRNSV